MTPKQSTDTETAITASESVMSIQPLRNTLLSLSNGVTNDFCIGIIDNHNTKKQSLNTHWLYFSVKLNGLIKQFYCFLCNL